MPYGIANSSGKIDFREGAAIIQRARQAGIDTLDTAIAYGDSESQLGKIGVTGWRAVSKLPKIPDGIDVVAWVRHHVDESLTRLRVHSLHGLLIHQPASLLGLRGSDIYAAMVEVKNLGLVGKIGISAYGPQDIDPILSRFKLDIVQAPLSIVDRRLISSGCLERIKEAGIEFYARSVFLQGLLLMDKLQRPIVFESWSGIWLTWHEWLQQARLTPLQACLGFVASKQGVNRFVVGVDSCIQLEQVLAAMKVSPNIEFPVELACQDPLLVNPSNWRVN
jgi:aryl-alcohol dehydrogenase-like predicted oxidoreductase